MKMKKSKKVKPNTLVPVFSQDDVNYRYMESPMTWDSDSDSISATNDDGAEECWNQTDNRCYSTNGMYQGYSRSQSGYGNMTLPTQIQQSQLYDNSLSSFRVGQPSNVQLPPSLPPSTGFEPPWLSISSSSQQFKQLNVNSPESLNDSSICWHDFRGDGSASFIPSHSRTALTQYTSPPPLPPPPAPGSLSSPRHSYRYPPPPLPNPPPMSSPPLLYQYPPPPPPPPPPCSNSTDTTQTVKLTTSKTTRTSSKQSPTQSRTKRTRLDKQIKWKKTSNHHYYSPVRDHTDTELPKPSTPPEFPMDELWLSPKEKTNSSYPSPIQSPAFQSTPTCTTTATDSVNITEAGDASGDKTPITVSNHLPKTALRSKVQMRLVSFGSKIKSAPHLQLTASFDNSTKPAPVAKHELSDNQQKSLSFMPGSLKASAKFGVKARGTKTSKCGQVSKSRALSSENCVDAAPNHIQSDSVENLPNSKSESISTSVAKLRTVFKPNTNKYECNSTMKLGVSWSRLGSSVLAPSSAASDSESDRLNSSNTHAHHSRLLTSSKQTEESANQINGDHDTSISSLNQILSSPIEKKRKPSRWSLPGLVERSAMFKPDVTFSEKTFYSPTPPGFTSFIKPVDTDTSWIPNYQAIYTKCSKVKFIDSHCHIDFLFNRKKYSGSLNNYLYEEDAITCQTMPSNFEGCVAIFCEPSFWKLEKKWQAFLNEDNIWGSFGLHPKYAEQWNEATEFSLKCCLRHKKVRALGEIGLDYSKGLASFKEKQQEAFRSQILIALEHKLPLVIHCRDAEEDCWSIMIELVPTDYKIHRHCFTENIACARRWFSRFPNLKIGLTPLVTFPSARATHQVARQVPLDRLLLETDAPYFIPRGVPRSSVPHSHPGMAITVAVEVSNYRGIPVDDVLTSVRRNTQQIYGI